MKQYIYLAVFLFIFVALAAAFTATFNAGADSVRAEYADKLQAETRRLTKEQKDKIEAAEHEAEYWRKIAVHIQQNPPVVTQWRTKIETLNPDCTHINGFSELWNTTRHELGSD